MAKEKYFSKLLVEGKNDQHLFWALCEQHSVKESFDIIDCDGINNLKDIIPVRIKEQKTNIVGIVVDADKDSYFVWSSLKETLEPLGYIFPDRPVYGGYIHNSQGVYPKIGIWVMPENTSPGMLEDFAKSLISNLNPLKLYVDEILDELERKGYNKYSTIHRSKAYIHTFLAWQEDPGTPIGLSITKHYLDHRAPSGVSLVEWINKLFN